MFPLKLSCLLLLVSISIYGTLFAHKIYILKELALETVGIFQADFATSAVDFLHRIGRTARAGQYGLVTSLYTESNRNLVDAIRQAKKLGQPVVIHLHLLLVPI